MSAPGVPSEGEAATLLRYGLMELAERLDGVISLGRGDPDLDTPAPVVERALESLHAAGSISSSPVRGLAELRHAIAARYERDAGVAFDSETEILVTNGAQEGLFLAMLALLDPGDRVLVPDPRYTSYDQAIEAAGGVRVEVETGRNYDFAVTPEATAARARGAKLFVLVNPSNPTSALVSEERVRAIAGVLREHDLVALSDEIYENLVFDGARVLPLAACPGMRERTITLSGFSKTYAMTGFRVGYLAGPAPFIEAATHIKAAVSGPCPVFTQRAALAALDLPDATLVAMREVFDGRRRVMMRGLDRLGIRYGYPGGGFYVWADVSGFGLDAEAFCKRLLIERRVLLFPGNSFGKRWSGFVRISLLQPEERIAEALERIRAFVELQRGE